MKTQNKLKKYLEKIKKENKKLNIFLELRDEKELFAEARRIDEKISKGKAGKLAGLIVGVKANICVKDLHASCASKTLENYKAGYDAHVVEKIKSEDGLIIGMLNMDEFASGSSGETSAFGATQNPVAFGKIPGGSSSGPAAAVAAEFCDLALGSDTGGSVRCPASHCGVVGIKPTYSAVSRYGLIDLAMSTDVIGVLGKNISDVKLLFNVIKGFDKKDAVSQNSLKANFGNEGKQKRKGKILGVLDLENLKIDERIKKLIDEKIKEISEKNNWKIKKIKIENLDLAVETYYPLVYVEAFSGTRKLDGRRFGKKIEESCGPEFLRRILGGAEISKAEHAGRYYYQSLKIKKLIEREFEKAFGQVDCVLSPVVPCLPWNVGEEISIEEVYASDILTIPSSLAGNCAMSVPVGFVEEKNLKIPVGLQIICDKFCEDDLLKFGEKFLG